MTAREVEAARRRLEEAILGEPPELTAEEVAGGAGITIEEARRLWRALGFADARDERAFTESDLRAVALLMSAVDTEAISFDLAVQLTRAVGQTISRLADWQVTALTSRVDELVPADAEPVQAEGESLAGADVGVETPYLQQRMQAALGLVDSVGVPFETLIIYAWRRHLAAALARVASTGVPPGAANRDEDPLSADMSVGFADLVGFTARSNEMKQHDIGDMVERFESRCHDVVAGQGGRVVKTLGDSVLFVAEQPAAAVEIGLGIIEAIGEDRRLPDVRVGVATGGIVLRLGDVFGPSVNLASRLMTAARRNRLIVDRATSDALDPKAYASRGLPSRDVRGFGVMEPVAVRRIRD
ncbi:adenylate/guanylate cyclase domain-containing protein [Nocardioidaceae bacterium]|nr:adenylate/guanylate cyclase domain-containing protein [Nocardioidaceae bacterium]